jgi:hypothetical protein
MNTTLLDRKYTFSTYIYRQGPDPSPVLSKKKDVYTLGHQLSEENGRCQRIPHHTLDTVGSSYPSTRY